MIFKTSYPASRKLLLDNVSELDIFLLWCKDFKTLEQRFRSPIIINGRESSGDRNANIGLISGRYVFRDFRLGKSFGAFQFAEVMSGYSGQALMEYLCERFNINVREVFFRGKIRNEIILNTENKPQKSIIEIDVSYKDWTVNELIYWRNHGWALEMINEAKIRSIDACVIRKNTLDNSFIIKSSELKSMMFSYDFGMYDGIFRRKIYSPQAESKYKWKNNAGSNVIQGLNTIQSHVPVIYITSSMKDIGPFWITNGRPCAVAPNSESTLLTVDQVRTIRQMSDRQVIWYDNDPVGILNARRQSELYGFEMSHNPIGAPKDPSDYVFERGLREFNNLLKN